MPPDTRESGNQVRRSNREAPGTDCHRPLKRDRPFAIPPMLAGATEEVMHKIDVVMSKTWRAQGQSDSRFEQVGLTFCISWLPRGFRK